MRKTSDTCTSFWPIHYCLPLNDELPESTGRKACCWSSCSISGVLIRCSGIYKQAQQSQTIRCILGIVAFFKWGYPPSFTRSFSSLPDSTHKNVRSKLVPAVLISFWSTCEDNKKLQHRFFLWWNCTCHHSPPSINETATCDWLEQWLSGTHLQFDHGIQIPVQFGLHAVCVAVLPLRLIRRIKSYVHINAHGVYLEAREHNFCLH